MTGKHVSFEDNSSDVEVKIKFRMAVCTGTEEDCAHKARALLCDVLRDDPDLGELLMGYTHDLMVGEQLNKEMDLKVVGQIADCRLRYFLSLPRGHLGRMHL